MAGRTSSQKVQAQAAENFANGDVRLSVLSVMPSVHDTTFYVVVVPRAVMRSGPFGWLSQAITSTWGKPTRFGDDLYDTLRAMEYVEPALKNDMPHIVTIHIKPQMTEGPPEGSFHYLSQGLPESVCVAIEEAILRNNGIGQRFAEWLRRIF